MITYAGQILKKRATELIPELREIDFYLQQDSSTDKNTLLFATPGLWFDFVPAGEVKTHGNRMRSAEFDVLIHLVTENVLDSGKRFSKDAPTDHMRLFDKVNKTFQGFGSLISYLPEFVALLNTPNDMRVLNSLTPNGVVLPNAITKAKMKSMQSYRCIIYDHSASKLFSEPSPQPALELNVTFTTY